MSNNKDLDLKVSEALSLIPTTHYQIAEMFEITPQAAEQSLKRLAENKQSLKTGAGQWVKYESKDLADLKTTKRKSN